MQSVPRWRNLLVLRNSANFSSTQLAPFHSTPVCNEKWKKKWNSAFKRGQQPSKNYERYVIREKRADTKRALRSLLFNCRDIGTAFQNEERTRGWDTDNGGNANKPTKKGRLKSEACPAHKIRNHRMRRKLRKGSLSEDDDDCPKNMFHATFGNRWYTWSFNPWTRSSQNSTKGFDWRDTFYNKSDDEAEQEDASESNSGNKTCNVGFCSDRAMLGLPLTGPLKKEDVKNAFHLSALKWHPDKHQGSSQAAAEEKFKQCVDAYKSLCSVLSAG